MPQASPRRTARVAGVLYFTSAVPAGFAVFVQLKLVVRDDAAATAANILGSEALFRLGFVADLIGLMIFAGAVVMLYQLFIPVNKSLALLAAVLSFIGCAVQAVDSLADSGALLFLKGGTNLAALAADQTQELALVFLKLNSLSYTVALGFFGASVVLFSILVVRSTFLPRMIGVLWAIAGLGYWTFSVMAFVSPPFAAHLSPFIPFGTALGEAAAMAWFVAKSVNVQKWEQQAAAGERRPLLDALGKN
jgi:hypothetical protein